MVGMPVSRMEEMAELRVKGANPMDATDIRRLHLNCTVKDRSVLAESMTAFGRLKSEYDACIDSRSRWALHNDNKEVVAMVSTEVFFVQQDNSST